MDNTIYLRTKDRLTHMNKRTLLTFGIGLIAGVALTSATSYATRPKYMTYAVPVALASVVPTPGPGDVTTSCPNQLTAVSGTNGLYVQCN